MLKTACAMTIGIGLLIVAVFAMPSNLEFLQIRSLFGARSCDLTLVEAIRKSSL
ncbi:hypothetical protein [Paraburkholderia jirisanensis]